MSPEYRVGIVVPYTFVVEADDEDEAEKKGWELFEEDIDAWHNPAVVESVEEIKRADNGKPAAIGEQTWQDVESAVSETRDRVDEIPLTSAFYRLTAEGRMPKILVQVDDETGQVEAARLRVAGIEYFFHRTTDNEDKRIEIVRHQGETPEGHKVSAYELPFDGWGTPIELPDS